MKAIKLRFCIATFLILFTGSSLISVNTKRVSVQKKTKAVERVYPTLVFSFYAWKTYDFVSILSFGNNPPSPEDKQNFLRQIKRELGLFNKISGLILIPTLD